MGTKVKTVKDDFDKMQKTLESLEGKRVNVGVLGGKHAYFASIHEYGCLITVTPKMRAYLHAIGLHLKNTTTEIIIPERSFLRSGFDSIHKSYLEKLDQMLALILGGELAEDVFLNLVGRTLSESLKKRAHSLDEKPKTAFTQKHEGGKTHPLFDTGQMIDGISWEVDS